MGKEKTVRNDLHLGLRAVSPRNVVHGEHVGMVGEKVRFLVAES